MTRTGGRIPVKITHVRASDTCIELSGPGSFRACEYNHAMTWEWDVNLSEVSALPVNLSEVSALPTRKRATHRDGNCPRA